MYTINFVLVVFFICALFLIETKQQSMSSPASDCMHTMCGNSYTLDLQTCLCVDTEPINDSSKSARVRRLSDKLIVSKLIRDNEFVMQASSDRCRNNEQWNGIECIPLISLCPGGYHWNGHTCIIQVLTQTVALVPSGRDSKCPLAAKINGQSNDSNSNSTAHSLPSLPLTVMPTYSTSPLCPFGFIWSDEKCIRSPSTCPSQYIFRENLCHLRVSTASKIIEATRPTIADNLRENTWSTESTNIDFNQNREHQVVESSTAATSTENDDQSHKHCCTIRSPRLCQRKTHNRSEQWQCYHHQYLRCGEFCTKSTLYLRPKKTMFIEPLLIIPPPPRRLQRFMLNLPHRKSNIGKQENCIAVDFSSAVTFDRNFRLCFYF